MKEPSDELTKVNDISKEDLHEIVDLDFNFNNGVYLTRISNQLAIILKHLNEGVEVWSQRER